MTESLQSPPHPPTSPIPTVANVAYHSWGKEGKIAEQVPKPEGSRNKRRLLSTEDPRGGRNPQQELTVLLNSHFQIGTLWE